ncbi:hypothetical protein CXG81DRAFT_23400 [Caulochytrium protostelioides]|uniref:Uncharacterized protein n=1 Tax=Caulochytrium protostelioides TaxID=1555241 RepID=A0A4P9XEN5_9FUNG|nr:hypothetical protein CXG81DRAFT_23400 [Caulochytrium protostelioides]|eukprot:RKP03988.1 hypothetical protein CXG81DRAFT_23400 [Caulochytrium protostelioides]
MLVSLASVGPRALSVFALAAGLMVSASPLNQQVSFHTDADGAGGAGVISSVMGVANGAAEKASDAAAVLTNAVGSSGGSALPAESDIFSSWDDEEIRPGPIIDATVDGYLRVTLISADGVEMPSKYPVPYFAMTVDEHSKHTFTFPEGGAARTAGGHQFVFATGEEPVTQFTFPVRRGDKLVVESMGASNGLWRPSVLGQVHIDLNDDLLSGHPQKHNATFRNVLPSHDKDGYSDLGDEPRGSIFLHLSYYDTKSKLRAKAAAAASASASATPAATGTGDVATATAATAATTPASDAAATDAASSLLNAIITPVTTPAANATAASTLALDAASAVPTVVPTAAVPDAHAAADAASNDAILAQQGLNGPFGSEIPGGSSPDAFSTDALPQTDGESNPFGAHADAAPPPPPTGARPASFSQTMDDAPPVPDSVPAHLSVQQNDASVPPKMALEAPDAGLRTQDDLSEMPSDFPVQASPQDRSQALPQDSSPPTFSAAPKLRLAMLPVIVVDLDKDAVAAATTTAATAEASTTPSTATETLDADVTVLIADATPVPSSLLADMLPTATAIVIVPTRSSGTPTAPTAAMLDEPIVVVPISPSASAPTPTAKLDGVFAPIFVEPSVTEGTRTSDGTDPLSHGLYHSGHHHGGQGAFTVTRTFTKATFVVAGLQADARGVLQEVQPAARVVGPNAPPGPGPSPSTRPGTDVARPTATTYTATQPALQTVDPTLPRDQQIAIMSDNTVAADPFGRPDALPGLTPPSVI